jgi:diacylglycerol kinase (ATP)
MVEPKKKSQTTNNNKTFKLALIINEFARGGNFRELITEELFKQINAFQNQTGHQITLTFTRTPQHVARAVPKLRKEGCNLFVIGGGDGTINDVLQHLGQDDVLIPIPFGNANDYARRLNIKNWQDSVQIVKNILSGKVSLVGVDIGEITFKDPDGTFQTKRFINNCGVGVTAATVERVEGRVNKAYLWNGFISLMVTKPFKLTFYSRQLQKNSTLPCLGFEALLSSQVGRFAHLAPYKHQNDGSIHFTIFRNNPIVKRLILMVLLQFGYKLVKTPLVEYYHNKPETDNAIPTNIHGITLADSSSFWGMLDRPVPAHVDGNLIEDFPKRIQRDCRITLRPKFLRSVTPC